jgi:hypothetical protein
MKGVARGPPGARSSISRHCCCCVRVLPLGRGGCCSPAPAAAATGSSSWRRLGTSSRCRCPAPAAAGGFLCSSCCPACPAHSARRHCCCCHLCFCGWLSRWSSGSSWLLPSLLRCKAGQLPICRPFFWADRDAGGGTVPIHGGSWCSCCLLLILLFSRGLLLRRGSLCLHLLCLRARSCQGSK